MTEQLGLFDQKPRRRYPNSPGSKGSLPTGKAAARKIDGEVERLYRLIRAALDQHGPMNPDEIAAKLGENPLRVRPRCSEMLARGELKPTGEERPSSLKNPSAVLTL